jgi:DNA-binding IclR family transcriptional regulator
LTKARDPLGNSIRILRWVAEQERDVVGVREVATALDMQPSTASRLLGALAEERLVVQDARTGGYSIGLELLRLGKLAEGKLDIRTIARPHMQRLVDDQGETIVLGLYDRVRREMLRVEKLEGSQPLRYVIEMEQWTEIFRGASGLGILAFLPEGEQEEPLVMADAEASDAEPWLRRDALSRELARIRLSGYACTQGRRLPGAAAISAPIFDHEGRVSGDIIMTVPEVRFRDEDERRLATAVLETAAAITVDSGGRVPRGHPLEAAEPTSTGSAH